MIETVIPSKRKFPGVAQFGPEFEMFGSNIDMDTVVEILVRQGVSAERTRHGHKVYTKWQVEPDSSIQPGSSNSESFELVGPVLIGEEGLHEVKRVLMIVKDHINPKVNKSCGFHVHFGPNSWNNDLDNLKAIVKNFLKFEDAFNLMVPQSRRQSQYCLSNNSSSALVSLTPREKFSKIDNCHSKDELANVIQDTRYYRLNLMTEKVTIEFRQHSATYEWTKACRWIKIISLFIQSSCDHHPTLNFNSDKSPEHKFDKLFSDVIKDSTLESWARQRKEKFSN